MKTLFCKRTALISILMILTASLFADITYKVEKGDTLYSISRKYQITVAELRTANNLSENDVIKAGQKLIIPDADIGTAVALSSTKTAGNAAPAGKITEYVVKKGDTLYGIAASNNISVDTLIKDNAITNNMVYPGQNLKIRIPNKSTIEIEECYGEDYTPPNDTTPVLTTYTVEKGDSLYQIAKKFGTTTDAIINLNNLKTNNLNIGQKLII